MKTLFFSILLSSFFNISLFAQDWDWTKTAGGPSVDKITGLAYDQTGNIFLTGYFDSTIVFDSTRLVSAGGTDVFVAKFDADGVLLWAKQVGGQNDDYSSGISTDITGNCYVTGFFFISGNVSTFGSTTISESGDADIFISKFTSTGKFLWVRNAGGRNDDVSNAIATDVSGNSYITGYFSGTALFGTVKATSTGYSDIFIAKYDAAGNLVWLKTAGGTYQDEAYSICTDVAGNCYLTGYFTGNAMFSGTMLASAGYFDTDVFLLKYNPSGMLVMAKRAGGTGNDFGSGIDVSNSGQIFISGVFKGTQLFGDNLLSTVSGTNGFVAKFEASGKSVWTRNTSGSSTNEFRQVSIDAGGNCYVVGSFSDKVKFGGIELTSLGTKDVCVAKYDSKGTLMWVLQGGGEGNDEGVTLSSDQAGNCYVGGLFIANATFGRAKCAGWGLQDIFISRIK
ncbi:MAG: SBBP repeat-containing protein [Bacteroidetes bacterium]|nr:SBBP repeat-containing protein [Bacteroidota bacterium]